MNDGSRVVTVCEECGAVNFDGDWLGGDADCEHFHYGPATWTDIDTSESPRIPDQR